MKIDKVPFEQVTIGEWRKTQAEVNNLLGGEQADIMDIVFLKSAHETGKRDVSPNLHKHTL